MTHTTTVPPQKKMILFGAAFTIIMVSNLALVKGLDVTAAHQMMAYFPHGSNCPSGWNDAGGFYHGRLIKAVNSGNGPGGAFGPQWNQRPHHGHGNWVRAHRSLYSKAHKLTPPPHSK